MHEEMIKVVYIVPTLWLSHFLGSRILLFHQEWVHARHDYLSDEYTLVHVCAGNQAHMGRHALICEDAKRNRQVAPWQTALHGVFSKTYLCGDTPCSEIVDSFTNSMYKLLFCALLLVASPMIVYVALKESRATNLLPDRLVLTNYKSKMHSS